MIYYMHMIAGKAAYYDGNQIVFSTVTRTATLCHDLKQIRRERTAARKWRKKQGFATFHDYGHRRVQTPK